PRFLHPRVDLRNDSLDIETGRNDERTHGPQSATVPDAPNFRLFDEGGRAKQHRPRECTDIFVEGNVQTVCQAGDLVILLLVERPALPDAGAITVERNISLLRP